MRMVQTRQCQLGEIAIADIQIDLKSRDDIPAVLRGLQLLYTDVSTRERLFELLDQVMASKADKTVGRPGMELWRIFVLATLKQGLNCDFDRLQELANQHQTIREMLGHSGWDDQTQYPLQTLVDNVTLLSPTVLKQLNQLIVEVGHELVKKSLATHCGGGVIRLWLRPMFTTPPMAICCGMRCARLSMLWVAPVRRTVSAGGANTVITSRC